MKFLKFLIGLFSIFAAISTARAAEVGKMADEDIECRYENGNIEAPPPAPVQFQLKPVEAKTTVPVDAQTSRKAD